jgi:hypothetical protein
MTQKLFDILTDDELSRLKFIGLTRNVRIKELTLGELEEMIKVLFPTSESCTIDDVFKQLKIRRAL